MRKEFIKDDNQARFFYVYYALVKNNPKLKLKKSEVMDAVWIYPYKIDDFTLKNNYKVDWKSKEFVQQIIKECGALAWCEREQAKLVNKAKEEVTNITNNNELRRILFEIADFVIKRDK